VDAESECSNCNVARTLKTVTPFAKRCRLRSFECPKCSSVFRIVAFGRRLQKPRRRLIGLSLRKRCGGLSHCLDAGSEAVLLRRLPRNRYSGGKA
jgi:hypothetical protein